MLRPILILLLFATTAAGQDLRAIGLLELGGRAGCTATLIADDFVLTAAHCLTAPIGGPRDAASLRFRPATAQGMPGPAFAGAALAVHPDLQRPGLGIMGRTALDLGIVRLADPVPPAVATPLPVARRSAARSAFRLASFRGPGGGARRVRNCPLDGQLAGVAALACAVVRGESGGAVLDGESGATALVGVVTASATRDGQPIAYIADVFQELEALLAAVAAAGQ